MSFFRWGAAWMGGAFGRGLVATLNLSTRAWIDNGDGTWDSGNVLVAVSGSTGVVTRNWVFVTNPDGGAFNSLVTAGNNSVTVAKGTRPGVTIIRCDVTDGAGKVRSGRCTIS